MKTNKAEGGFSLIPWEKTINYTAKLLTKGKLKPENIDDEMITKLYIEANKKQSNNSKKIFKGVTLIISIIAIIVFTILIIRQQS